MSELQSYQKADVSGNVRLMNETEKYNASSIETRDGFRRERWDYAVEHGALYDSNGNLVGGEIIGTANRLIFTLPDGWLWEDLFASHTHTGNYGGTFSVVRVDKNTNAISGDIYHLTYANLIGYEANCKEGVYTILRTSKSDRKGFFDAAREAEESAEDSALEIVADRWAEIGRVVNSQQAYLENMEERRAEKARIMHEWFSSEAGRFGYKYSFTARDEL